ncbi:gluconokinase [Shewanella sp. SR44-4]|jgi:gluconokinase|uniref:gluconokinase n=1 Tax=Shewanella sp. SR44-4 TaxID=2760935 RepID=UPI00160394A7|nr:gluconokinase [Shewanella sp. SR44-4]MBB1360850.1 gluconokinase [Shewanella sp. SR44-4]|tara:strand:- start:475 stop:987 length:513 start_codon:yes stop_codon:yes gene_type:complete
MTGKCIIVMGVCACGKSSVGELLAKMMNATFVDGDDLHPQANIEKMARGEPLNDADRAPWLSRIGDLALEFNNQNKTVIIGCSALKKSYRDLIRQGNQQVGFLYLQGSYELILARIMARKGHFMKQNMVDSQFATLEEPTNEPLVVTVDINASITDIVKQALAQFNALGF